MDKKTFNSGDRLRILIVDDDRRMASTLADILELQVYKTAQAHSGYEALEKINQSRFDCILSDVKMAGMNGVELFQAIREIQPGLPVVLMTAYAADELIRKGLQNGAVGVLNKPIDIHQLLGFLACVRQENVVTIVDDDPAFCTTLSDILERRGFRVTKITNAETEVDKMLQNSQIMLLDMKLDNRAGYDALKEIRRSHPELPVLLVTGYQKEMASAIEQALEFGTYTCLYKPLVVSELLETLAQIRSERMKQLLKSQYS